MTSRTTAAGPEVTSAVARAGRVVGNASYGLAVVYAESLTAAGFDGTYTCIGRLDDADLPQYTILQYSLSVGEIDRYLIFSQYYKNIISHTVNVIQWKAIPESKHHQNWLPV